MPDLNADMTRRRFLRAIAAAGGGVALSGATPVPAAVPSDITFAKLPRWRGFNLLEKFNHEWPAAFRESDFQWISEFGFDFVRLPMSYRCWIDNGDWRTFNESALKEIDKAVELGRKYAIHTCINFHRAPGYCVNPPKESASLWDSAEALEVCASHWKTFAKRYQGQPNSQVSFNLLNEPPDVPEENYYKVVERLVEAIRGEDPRRLIIADGRRWGTIPCLSLANLKVAQAARGYEPMRISHHKAAWIPGSDQWPEPTWPLKIGDNDVWDQDRLFRDRIKPWKELEAKGSGIMVGECGAHNQTPHEVALKWMDANLELWKDAGWGFALWNFRGSFGIVDSERKDVRYEDFRGHKLDREFLTLLGKY